MSNTTDQMPLKEESLREKYSAAESFWTGLTTHPDWQKPQM